MLRSKSLTVTKTAARAYILDEAPRDKPDGLRGEAQKGTVKERGIGESNPTLSL